MKDLRTGDGSPVWKPFYKFGVCFSPPMQKSQTCGPRMFFLLIARGLIKIRVLFTILLAVVRTSLLQGGPKQSPEVVRFKPGSVLKIQFLQKFQSRTGLNRLRPRKFKTPKL